jgi:hypothetical protein
MDDGSGGLLEVPAVSLTEVHRGKKVNSQRKAHPFP